MMKFRIVDEFPVQLEIADVDADTVFDRERLAVALDQLTTAAWCSCGCTPCSEGRHCHNRNSGCF